MEDSQWGNVATNMASSGEAQTPSVNSGSLNSSPASPCSIEDSLSFVIVDGCELTSSPQQSTLQSWVAHPCGKMRSSGGTDLNRGLQKLQDCAASTLRLVCEPNLLLKGDPTKGRKINAGLQTAEKEDEKVRLDATPIKGGKQISLPNVSDVSSDDSIQTGEETKKVVEAMKLEHSEVVNRLKAENAKKSEALQHKSFLMQDFERYSKQLNEKNKQLHNQLEICRLELIAAQGKSIKCLEDFNATKQVNDLLKEENKQLKRLNTDAQSQIETYELQLADGRNVINSLKQDIEDLTTKNICVTCEVARLQKQKEEYETEIKRLRETGKESELKEEASKLDIQNLQKELYKQQTQNRDLQNQFEIRGVELEDSKTTLREMQDDLDRVSISEDYARSEVIILKQKDEESVNELQQLRLDAEIAKQKEINQTKAVGDLREEMRECKTKYSECSSQLMSYETQVSDLQQKVNLLKSENEALEVNKNSFEQEAACLQQKNQEYGMELEQLRKLNNRWEETKRELLALNETWLQELAESKNSNQEKDTQLTSCWKDLSNLKQKLDFLQKEKEALKVKENRVQEEAACLRLKTKEYEVELHHWTEVNKEMKDNEKALVALNEELKRKLENSKEIHSELASRYAVSDTELLLSKKTVDVLQKENEELKENKNHAKQEAACLQQKNQEYGIKLEQMREVSDRLNERKEELLAMNEKLLQELAESKKSNQEKDTQLSYSRTELSNVKQTLDSLQKEKEALKVTENHSQQEAAHLKQKTQEYEAQLNHWSEVNKEMKDEEKKLVALNQELKQKLEEFGKKNFQLVSDYEDLELAFELTIAENIDLKKENENHVNQKAACSKQKNQEYGAELEQMRKPSSAMAEYKNKIWSSNSPLTSRRMELSISKQEKDLGREALRSTHAGAKVISPPRGTIGKVANQLDDTKKENEKETLQKYGEPELDMQPEREEVTPRSQARNYHKVVGKSYFEMLQERKKGRERSFGM